MKRLVYGVVMLTGLLVAGCTTTEVSLTYNRDQAAQHVANALPVVEVAKVDDQRKVDAKWLGAIRGGFGNPLKNLEADRPVSELVKAAFESGLSSRGLRAEPGKARIAMELTIRKLDCSQYVRREAHVELDIVLKNLADRRTLFTAPVSVTKVSGGNILDVGIFASVEDLRAVMNGALQEAVDQALDTPSLLARLKDGV
ncbi:MAG: hypothetical protein WCJ64_02785 [Rhodospirillaceae bacterium]